MTLDDIEQDLKSGEYDINDLWIKARVRARNIGQGESPENVVEMLCADIAKLKESSQQLINLYEGKVLQFPRVVSPELHGKNQEQRNSFRKELYDEIIYLQNQGFHIGHISSIMSQTPEEINKILSEFKN